MERTIQREPRSPAHRRSAVLARRALPLVTATCLLMLGGAMSAAADEPWQFEQVTPADKGGGAVAGQDTFQTRPDGNLLLHTAASPYDSIPTDSAPAYVRYLGLRNPAGGWSNVSLDAPNRYINAQAQNQVFSVSATSENLEYSVIGSYIALTPGAISGGSNVYLRENRTRQLELIAASPSPALANYMTVGASSGTVVKFVADDGNSLLLVSPNDTPLTVGATGKSALYSWVRDRGIRAESVLPGLAGDEVVDARPNVYDSETGPRNARPTGDGLKRIYFGAWAPGSPGSGGSDAPLYVREDGESKLVSYSRRSGAPTTPVPIKTLDSVSRDGRYAVFSIDSFAQQLTDDAATAGGEFQWYRYDAVNDSLTYLWSANGAAVGPGIAGLAEASQDGSTIVFRSQQDLAPGGVDGLTNVYVWHDGDYAHVATLDADSSGSTNTKVAQQLSANGRYVAFADDSASLALSFGINNMSEGCPGFFGGAGPCDVAYVYDVAQDELKCASCRSDGGVPRGAAGLPGSQSPGFKRMNAYSPQMVSNDGDLYFGAVDGLVNADQNGAADVYRYRVDTGQQTLVSRARPGTSARLIDSSADGRTVFFATNDPISPRDHDVVNDIYMTGPDARTDAAEERSSDPPCRGTDCRDAGSSGVDGPTPGTNQADRLPSVPAPPVARAKVRVVDVQRRGTRLRVVVSASVGGRVRLSGPAITSTSRTISSAGSIVLTSRLNAATRRALTKKHRARVRLRASLSPPFGKSRVVSVVRTVRK